VVELAEDDGDRVQRQRRPVPHLHLLAAAVAAAAAAPGGGGGGGRWHRGTSLGLGWARVHEIPAQRWVEPACEGGRWRQPRQRDGAPARSTAAASGAVGSSLRAKTAGGGSRDETP
jgi:hypothetical protein